MHVQFANTQSDMKTSMHIYIITQISPKDIIMTTAITKEINFFFTCNLLHFQIVPQKQSNLSFLLL